MRYGVSEINKLLAKICRKLSSGDVVNYCANVEIFQGNSVTESNEIDLIISALGKNAEVGGVEKSNITELLDVIKECFEYVGDEGSYPNQVFLSSSEFKAELNQVLEQIKGLFLDNSEIFAFWLKEGHPFYPVFWDYAFLVKKDEGNYVLIGSSSD